MLKQDLIWSEEVQKFYPGLLETFKHLHQHPELSDQEFETTKFIISKLQEIGLKVTSFTDTTGAVADLQVDPGKPTLAIRCDMDALPISENSRSEYPSKNAGVMHACGHDLHMTVGLGVAQTLSHNRDVLPCNVRFIFQPGEETSTGAKAMIRHGVLDNPQIKAIIGFHSNPELLAGQIGVKAGALMAAENDFEIEIIGLKSHGAQPHIGKDALLAAASTVVLMQSIISRNVDPQETAVVSVGTFNSGSALNIISDSAKLTGTIRSFNKDIENLIVERLNEIVDNTAKAFGCKGKVEYSSELFPVINDAELIQLIQPGLASEFGTHNIVSVNPSMASEDFCHYLQTVRGFLLWIGSSRNAESSYPLHNPAFMVDPVAIQTGVAAVCKAAVTVGRSLIPNE
ncbi:MAG: M20 family metallopeptidase [Chloroflexi bacterium]|nr:M20 family metallopeptidase [Chloroflexota bacterium]